MNGLNDAQAKTNKVLTTDGKLVDAPLGDAAPAHPTGKAARAGVPNRNFVMVVDLARCKNARACVDACQEGHHIPKDQEWIKVLRLQEGEDTAPYWFPKPCYHCDEPSCVSVCPVQATYKRDDGLVLVDTNACIGCKYCMVACPYSARTFNWRKPQLPKEVAELEYSPETAVPQKVGTVGKCVFCADLTRHGKLPRCVSSCPMGAIYFGDRNEDSVSNGTEVAKFTDLMVDRAGYRYMEELGTEPRVYYLPPVNRMFPFQEAEEAAAVEGEKKES